MIKNLNNKIIYLIIIFMIISILLINSSMLFTNLENLPLKQIIWYTIGFILIKFSKYFPDNKRSYLLFYIFNLVLLGLVLLTSPINGSNCWITIPKLGSFQPSEFMKVALILVTSQVIKETYKNKANSIKKEIKLLLILLLIYIPPTILTFLEPDTGAILIYFIIGLSMLLFSPIRKRWFILIGLIISIIILILILNQNILISIFGNNIVYRIERILDWKNKSSMQLENTLIAMGSGGLFGKGYLNTPIYFPESSTDFIFAHLISMFGLIGGLIFIYLIVLFDICLLKKINNHNKYIVIGTISILLFSQLINISMVLGLIPIIGITLPFISYGGSSLLSYFLLISLILKEKEE